MKKVFLAALLFVGITTFAQKKREQREKLTPEQRVELQAKKMKLDLDLNDKQVADVKKLLLEQAKKREAKKEEIIELIRQGKGRREIIQEIGIKYKDLGDFLREIIESGELKKNKESSKENRRDLIEQDDGR